MRKWTSAAAAVLLITLVGVVDASKECRFAPSYNREDLMKSSDTRLEFTKKIIEKEARFVREVGVDKDTGLTIG